MADNLKEIFEEAGEFAEAACAEGCQTTSM